MTQEQWLAEERRKFQEREALLKRCSDTVVFFEKDPRKDTKAPIKGGG